MPTVRTRRAALSIYCFLGFLTVAGPQLTYAEPTPAQQESALLHKRLDFGGVRAFDEKTGRWQPYRRASESLLVVHLWAVECAPCVAEMPTLRSFVAGWRDEPALRFLFISETLEEKKLLDFWRAAAARVPSVAIYQNADDRIRGVLENGRQPITLLVDQDLIIRQAFVGSLVDRTSELAASMTRFLTMTRHKK